MEPTESTSIKVTEGRVVKTAVQTIESPGKENARKLIEDYEKYKQALENADQETPVITAGRNLRRQFDAEFPHQEYHPEYTKVVARNMLMSILDERYPGVESECEDGEVKQT